MTAPAPVPYAPPNFTGIPVFTSGALPADGFWCHPDVLKGKLVSHLNQSIGVMPPYAPAPPPSGGLMGEAYERLAHLHDLDHRLADIWFWQHEKAIAERDALRRIVEEAPHASTCALGLGPAKTPTPFVAFKKIPRLSREVVVTEKIDGTNASIFIGDDGEFLTGSRTRWITPDADNHGFSRWAHANKDELMRLGPGMHYGEYWGSGIQRGYGLQEKRFSLFNTARWSDPAVRPACCHVVPVLWAGPFDTTNIGWTLAALALQGSSAAPGFRHPEGIVIFHVAGNLLFKKTLENDGVPKGVTSHG